VHRHRCREEWIQVLITGDVRWRRRCLNNVENILHRLATHQAVLDDDIGLGVFTGARFLCGLCSMRTCARFAPYPSRRLPGRFRVYFGHLQNYGSSHPVLTDVFYVVSQTDPETKQVKSSLVKRGKEMHEPDSMYLNPSQIVFVETVGTNSKVAQLIVQASH
jgi:hypothetical protein